MTDFERFRWSAASRPAIHRILSSPRPTGGARLGALPNRSPETEGGEWFDLFFDLVFAVAIVLWAEQVGDHPTVGAYARGVAELVPIWWLWLGQTLFAARFPVDRPMERLLALAVVVAVGVMSTELVADPTRSLRFPLGFVAARAALLALYASVRGVSSDARRIADAYLVGFGAGAGLWAVSALLPASQRGAAWALGLAIDFSVPWLARPRLQRMPLDDRYVRSRVGAFTSLLLYVSIESLVRGLTETGWSAWTSVVALLSFALVVTSWWIYAARVNRQDMRSVFGSSALPYLYSHLAIVLGVGTLSVGVRVAVEAGGPGGQAARGVGFVAAGLSLWITGLVLVRAVVLRHRDRWWHWPFLAAGVFFPSLAAVGATRRPIATLGAYVGVLFALLTLELRHGRAHARAPHRL
ncbi:low temperature requirement protein A [Anaeromyxobacter terrae]|uniref:low temperature requirement protein A n=1 Tax=Anaeromyxobacter terrae TaxID=2925406 RepID=UPI001F57620F|nr:low temperature requirement protein A [Anaeromyxobacter sp. SG22]